MTSIAATPPLPTDPPSVAGPDGLSGTVLVAVPLPVGHVRRVLRPGTRSGVAARTPDRENAGAS